MSDKVGNFSNIEAYVAIGICSLGESPNEEIRAACDVLAQSGNVSDYQIKTIINPIRNAKEPLHMYRTGLKALRVIDELAA